MSFLHFTYEYTLDFLSELLATPHKTRAIAKSKHAFTYALQVNISAFVSVDSFFSITFCKVFSSFMTFYQALISLATVTINLYCLVVILASKKLRSVEFVFIGAQTVVDLLLSGLINFVLSVYLALEQFEDLCLSYSMYLQFVDPASVGQGMTLDFVGL